MLGIDVFSGDVSTPRSATEAQSIRQAIAQAAGTFVEILVDEHPRSFCGHSQCHGVFIQLGVNAAGVATALVVGNGIDETDSVFNPIVIAV